ncbi:MAG TPA: T9SS type A sorting domain-containing protein, partial [Chitinophagales bacterium]|nr:T9SS type A sorting domain-containing protein [Chitinophagales bacterium]
AHQADAWATALPAGINHKYTDCNGDGMIDATDEEAVDANYSFEHPLYNLRTTEGEVPLYYSMDAPISIGENSVPIYLGDAANMVDAIYGIRFTATASGEVIEPASVYVTFEDSWFGDAGDMLQLSKSKTAAADAGLVKTDHTNSDGYGQIGTLHFVVIDNIAGKVTADEITLGFESARAIDVTGTELSLEAIESVVDITLNADAQSSPQFVIYPNPVSEQVLFVTTPLQAATVTLVDITGKTVLEAQVSGQRINLPELPAGQYILRIVQDGLSHNQSICLQ